MGRLRRLKDWELEEIDGQVPRSVYFNPPRDEDRDVRRVPTKQKMSVWDGLLAGMAGMVLIGIGAFGVIIGGIVLIAIITSL